MRLPVAGLLVGVLAGCSAFAQSVISAHSGVVHYTEGRVLVGDKVLETKFAQFPDLKNDQELRTEEGRAEILLTPGVFLRVGENSSIRMVSNHLSDTRVEVLQGSAMVECDELLADNAITLLYKGTSMRLLKHGLYRVDTDPARFRVYEGEATVQSETGQLTLKHGKETLLDGALMAASFDTKTGDELYRWSSRRSNYLAMANVSAAKNASTYSSGWSSSGWMWNPWYGMFTFVPYRGTIWSPFGYGFWSPFTVGQYYSYYYYNPGYSYGRPGGSGGGSQSGYVSQPRSSAGSFSGSSSSVGASAPVSRSGPSMGGGNVGGGSAGGGRSSGGGGRGH